MSFVTCSSSSSADDGGGGCGLVVKLVVMETVSACHFWARIQEDMVVYIHIHVIRTCKDVCTYVHVYPYVLGISER